MGFWDGMLGDGLIIEGRLGVLELQQAKLEGLLEGLREAISGRAMAKNKDRKKA